MPNVLTTDILVLSEAAATSDSFQAYSALPRMTNLEALDQPAALELNNSVQRFSMHEYDMKAPARSPNGLWRRQKLTEKI